MKKTIGLLFIGIGFICLVNSCSKSCTCTRWADGEVKESITVPLYGEDNNLCEKKIHSLKLAVKKPDWNVNRTYIKSEAECEAVIL